MTTAELGDKDAYRGNSVLVMERAVKTVVVIVATDYRA